MPSTTPGSANAESLQATLAGQTIAGRYKVLDLLGRGGMGAVYRARDMVVGEEIALKVLHPADERDPLEVERFKRELLTARRIAHPNVIRIHDMGAVGSDLFISMEILDGGSLGDRLTQGPIPLPDAVDIAIGVCDGLQAAHEQGIIHRDLKPDNILFDKAGRAKLVDFGLARLSDATASSTGFGGTPFYMSPELVEGGEQTLASDIYSLGVVLFELFTGSRPFEADTLLRLARMHAEQAPPRPRSLRGDLPLAVERIILQCLEKVPAKRPASAGEIAEVFRSLGLAPRRPTPSAPYLRAARTLRRSPWNGSPVSLAVLGLAGAGIAGTAFFLASRPSPQPTTTGSPPPPAIAIATPSVLPAPSVPVATPRPTRPAVALSAVTRSKPRPAAPVLSTPIPTATRVAAIDSPPPSTPTPALPLAVDTPPPVDAPPPAGAEVKVAGDPGTGVNVLLDGKPAGDTPWDRKVTAGRHTITLENPDTGWRQDLPFTLEAARGPLPTVKFWIVKGADGSLTVQRKQ